MPDDSVLANDVSAITSIIGCDEEYYQESRDRQYDEYTLYLVNTGADVEDQAYSDLYYGERKVTDVFVVDNYPGTASYPDDKLYLVPLYGEDVWELPGSQQVAPVGFNAYFKHNGIVTPMSSSLIQEVNYNPETESASIVWNTEGGTQVVTDLISYQAVENMLENLPEEVISDIASQVSSSIIEDSYEQIYSDLYDDIVVDGTKASLGPYWKSVTGGYINSGS